MNDQQQEVLKRILHVKEDLPKRQKQLCDYMVEHFEELEMYTLSELSKEANVGVSTIMRVMKEIGVESYKELRKQIHEEVTASRTTWWHMQKSFENTKESHVLTDVWKEVNDLVEKTITKSMMSEFDRAVELMLQSKNINILGLRSSKASAIYFGHLLEEFYPDVTQLSHESDLIYDRVFRLTENDVLILIINAPYTKLSVEIAKFCYDCQIPIILITDYLSGPAASYSSIILHTKSSEKQYSIIPTIAILESLVIAFGREKSDTSISQLEALGNMLSKSNIHYF
ncbi:MurR/RpiR family transcriptional regulator [Oceanobacillus timonensis]|uniref:MurR/RpiR family transcriptional regulator n=1 Tax=Oceanobacillus timonensis TaxID=1926285 RepID=UPI0015C43A47|nr:MurR/RpiR family transcriptional regulator [Oceanobacillus timonensis]